MLEWVTVYKVFAWVRKPYESELEFTTTSKFDAWKRARKLGDAFETIQIETKLVEQQEKL